MDGNSGPFGAEFQVTRRRVSLVAPLALVVVLLGSGCVLLQGNGSDEDSTVNAEAPTTVQPNDVAPDTAPATASTGTNTPQDVSPLEPDPVVESPPIGLEFGDPLAVVSSTALAPAGMTSRDPSQAVGIDATRVVDGDPNTALTVSDGGVGHGIQIRLVNSAEIHAVGIRAGGSLGDADGREIRVVRWILDDGTAVIQEVSDAPGLQFAEVPPTESAGIRLEILAATGTGDPTISEIAVFGQSIADETVAAAPEVLIHVFPLDPPDAGTYNPGGHGYPAIDIFAPVGTSFVAVTSGVVDVISTEDVWDPNTNDGADRGGLYVGIIGDDGIRYYGSHLSWVADGLESGTRVNAGQLLGQVGRSGNARETTPHLHFGISAPTYPDDWQIRRGQIDPVPFLNAWRAGDAAKTPRVDP